MTAQIKFSRDSVETTVPDIRVTRSRTGKSGTATFYFEDPQVLAADSQTEITGMYLVDEEGEITTKEVNAKFINGQARGIEATVVMRSATEWERFIRFMNRYAETSGLELQRNPESEEEDDE